MIDRMPLTYEQRLELLKKAREAKKAKANAKKSKAEPGAEPETIPEVEPETEPEPVKPNQVKPKPKKTSSKSVTPSGRTLDIKEPALLPEFIDSEPEVEEQIIYKPKDKKKKKIIKRIIMEQSSDEEEVEVIEEHVRAPKKDKQIVPKEPPTPKLPPNNPFFNF